MEMSTSDIRNRTTMRMSDDDKASLMEYRMDSFMRSMSPWP